MPEAINRAALWQSGTSNSVTYGAAGSQVVVDGSGDVTAKDFVGLDTVSGSLGSFVTVDASSAAITNGITASTLTTSGDISGKDLLVTGTVSGTTGSFVTLNASNAAITNGITATSLTASGAITGASGTFTTLNGTNAAITNDLTAANLTASGTVTGATGVFTTLNATNATITGTANLGTTTVRSLTDTGTLAVTGATTGSTATYSGIVTAAGFSGTMSLGTGGVTMSGIVPIINGGTGASSASSALNNLGATVGGVFNTGLLTAGLINGAYLTANSVTSTQLNATGVSSGTCPNPTVSADGRITACGSAAPAAAAGTTGDIQFNNSGSLGAAGSLYWSNTNGFLGVGTSSPAGILDVEGGTAAASTAGTNIKLVAQNGGTGNANGGNIFLTTGTGSGTGYGGTVLIGSSCSGASWLAYGLCATGDILSEAGFATPSFQPYGWGTSSANITGVGGSNTGDQIRFITNSVERGRFDGSGHFGIGTINPQNTLDVNGAAAIGASYAGVSTSPTNGLIVQGRVGIGTSNPQQIFQAHAAANQNIAITGNTTLSSGALLYSMTDNNTAYQPLEIAASQFDFTQGNVGIGTTAPQSALQVNGEAQVGSSGASCGSSNSGAIRYSSGSLLFCNGTTWTTINTGATTSNNAGWGAFKNLLIVNDGTTPNTIEDITSDYVNVTNGSGNYYLAQSVVCNVNLASSGAGGLDTGSLAASTGYYTYVIYNGTTVSCLGSLSATAPTMPSSYTYKALVGWNSTDSTSKLYRVRQIGKPPGRNLSSVLTKK